MPQNILWTSADQNKGHLTKWNTMFEMFFATLLLGFLKKTVDPPSSWQQKCLQEMRPTFTSDTKWENVIFKIVQESHFVEEIRTFNFIHSFG